MYLLSQWVQQNEWNSPTCDVVNSRKVESLKITKIFPINHVLIVFLNPTDHTVSDAANETRYKELTVN